jgi:GTP-dependent phosphoenolpyruvate carboxykinase
MRVLPSKRLFNSTTIWEIVNRGDIFAVDMETGVFTVIPGKEEVNIVRVATVTIDLV